MKFSFFGMLTVVSVLTLPVSALADDKPRGSQPATAERLAQLYAGNTELWRDSCAGGIYYSPNWQVRAWCAEQGESLGAGTWSTDDQGRLCSTLTWFYPNGSGAAASEEDTSCISHVVDRRGQIWRSWPNDAEWWPMDRRSRDMVRGYRFQNDIRTTQSQLGL